MTRNKSLAALALAIAAGCSSTSAGTTPTGNQNPSPSPSSSPDSGVNLPPVGGDDAGQDSNAPPQGGDDAGPGQDYDSAPPPPPAIALPFYVSDQFLPTGFMGDSQASMAAITLAHDAATCKSPRQPGAGGDCYTATWAPTVPDAGSSWAGVYWQSPANNWGSKPGKAIAAGATKVSFYAAGAVGGEVIQLCAGGINVSGATAALPYSDSFSVKQPAITLTTSWTQYELSLQGATYTSVLGAFCWVTSSTSTESITFYIDDVQWQ